jgi:hypothetical protein
MFDDLKAKLAEVEGRLSSMLGSARGVLSGLKGEVQGIDAGVLARLDQVAAQEKQAESAVSARLAAVKAAIQQLAPPG